MDAYRTWCDDKGRESYGKGSFNRTIRALGFTAPDVREAGAVVWTGASDWPCRIEPPPGPGCAVQWTS